MAIPNAALQKVNRHTSFPMVTPIVPQSRPNEPPPTNQSQFQLLQEVETQAALSQQQISQTQSLISTRRRDARLNQLTSTEISQLPATTPIYEGVGRMFVAVPNKEMSKRLKGEEEKLKKEIGELEKKLHYQETTFRNSREAMERIMQSGGRA